MKVFNLCCENEHAFEGWFASGEAYDAQRTDGLPECPMCGSPEIRRLPSAPRLNLSGAQPPASGEQAPRQMVAQPTAAQLQQLWSRMAALIQANTEDVGERFAEEARRIHYNEAPERGIRGIATAEEAAELADEGIDVMQFPMPVTGKGPVQ